MANGIFNHYGTTTPASTGAANTDTTLLSRPLAGGAVDDGNAFQLRAEFVGAGLVRVRFGGVDVFLPGWDTGPSNAVYVFDVWRVGRYDALVRASYCDMTTAEWKGLGRYPVAGIDWQSQQTIEIVGKSATAGGLTLERAGIAK